MGQLAPAEKAKTGKQREKQKIMIEQKKLAKVTKQDESAFPLSLGNFLQARLMPKMWNQI